MKAWTVALSLSISASATAVHADFTTRVVASGLSRPTGIASRGNQTLYFTQLPTPGVAGPAGGRNTVDRLDLRSRTVTNLTTGEPEPTNLAALPSGELYWTCKSAGVILQRTRAGQVSPLLTGLRRPSGIAVDQCANVYFTELPTPGVPGSAGGQNRVSLTDGDTTTVLTTGEPEPTDIASDMNGNLYWTCKSAGVILRKSPSGSASLLLNNLDKPTGIALSGCGRKLYFTEVPTPGVPGSMGGSNKVWEYDLDRMTRSLIHHGDPEPTDVTVTNNGNVYWTCSSAGVIVEARKSR
jgi:hypothetical protein